MSNSYFFFDGTDWDLGNASRQVRNAKFSKDIQSVSQNGGQLAGRRNKIINGAGQVNQRGTVNLINNGGVYGGVDRFISFVGATTVSGNVQQAVGFGTNPIPRSKYGNLMLVTSTGATTIVQSTRLERVDTFVLNGLTVTLSCMVFQDTGLTLTATLEMFKATAADNFTGTTSLGSSNFSVPTATWTKLSKTFTLGAADAAFGLQCSAYYGSIAAVTNNNFYFTDWHLEEGSIATLAEQHPFAQELMLCRRYYEKSYDYGTVPGTAALGGNAQSIAATSFILSNGHVRYQVEKRAPPTVTLRSTNAGTSGFVSEYNAGGVFVADRACTIATNGTTGYELQVNGVATVGNNERWQWTSECEL